MEHIFVLKSTDSTHFYPDNTITRFRIKLYNPLTLKGCWKVALTELHLFNVKGGVPNALLVQSPLCENLTVVGGDKHLPVLRYIARQKPKDVSWTFENPMYLSVNQTFVESLEINITDGEGNPLSFQSGTLVCVLHLVRGG